VRGLQNSGFLWIFHTQPSDLAGEKIVAEEIPRRGKSS